MWRKRFRNLQSEVSNYMKHLIVEFSTLVALGIAFLVYSITIYPIELFTSKRF